METNENQNVKKEENINNQNNEHKNEINNRNEEILINNEEKNNEKLLLNKRKRIIELNENEEPIERKENLINKCKICNNQNENLIPFNQNDIVDFIYSILNYSIINDIKVKIKEYIDNINMNNINNNDDDSFICKNCIIEKFITNSISSLFLNDNYLVDSYKILINNIFMKIEEMYKNFELINKDIKNIFDNKLNDSDEINEFKKKLNDNNDNINKIYNELLNEKQLCQLIDKNLINNLNSKNINIFINVIKTIIGNNNNEISTKSINNNNEIDNLNNNINNNNNNENYENNNNKIINSNENEEEDEENENDNSQYSNI